MVTKKLLRPLLLGALCCFPVTAVLAQTTPNYGTWGFDSIKPSVTQTVPTSDPSDYQQIYSLLLTMAGRWNAHDLDGFLDVFWNSPELLIVVEGEQMKGWSDFSATYHRGYGNNRTAEMGTLVPERIQIQMITPDVAVAFDWWTMLQPNTTFGPARKVLGTTTATLRKFSDGWKIVLCHTSFVEP
jgi:beta-aspartyl-peptidase (threonine type)